MSDNTTIQLKRGDKKTLEQIYNGFYDKIYSFIFFKVNNQEKAEDLAGEVFIKFIDYLKDHDIDNVNALLYKIARNLIIDDSRKKKEELIGDEAMGNITDNNEQSLDFITNEQLFKVVFELKDDFRDVIVMYYLNEMTTKEIADIFEKSEGAVRTMLSRAIGAIKEKINIR